jgi:DNA repair exonuclease SbcCD ATPase subunit
MRTVKLGVLFIENFKSFLGTNEITMTVRSGLKYITGTNEVNPRLGSNGSGKTSVLDAIFWCWTGYSIRGHRAADLASWGTKSPRVLTGLRINGEMYLIDRSGSPNRLLINDQPAEQHELDTLLLSRKRLLHSVFFGQSVDFFFDLSVPERGALLDEVMNLDLWLKLAEKATAKNNELSKAIAETENTLSYNKGLLDGLVNQHTETRTACTNWETKWQTDMATEMAQLEQRRKDVAADEQAGAGVRNQLLLLPNLAVMRASMQGINQEHGQVLHKLALVQEWVRQNDEHLAFFENHETCSQCEQPITPTFRTRKVAELQKADRDLLAEQEQLAQAETHITTTLKEMQQQYQQGLDRTQTLERQAAFIDQRLQYEKAAITNSTKAIEARIANPNNPYTESLALLSKQVTEQHTALTGIEDTCNELKGERVKYDYWRTGFKRVRLYEVKQILAHLELATANAAYALGIDNWRIRFSTEVETKSGTMKPGVHITVSEPDGRAMVEESGGEEQRVRLAVSMGLSALIQDMAGIRFDFEYWDEPSAWLSAEGIDDLLDQLRDRAESMQKSIWLLDHRVANYADFVEVWNVTKTAEGSKIAQRYNLWQGIVEEEPG